MAEIRDDEIDMINREINRLIEKRQKRIDVLNDPTRKRVAELYAEIASRFDELIELGDPAYTETEVYVGYDEHKMSKYAPSFEGKYFTFFDGKIGTK